MTTQNTPLVFSSPDHAKSVLELIREAGFPLAAPCGGNKTCGKCVVKLAGCLSPVTDTERAIFDAACSNYQFPLGTPQTVGKRTTPDGTDYKYTVTGRGFNGEESKSTIYVTIGKGADAKPEFTEVVR